VINIGTRSWLRVVILGAGSCASSLALLVGSVNLFLTDQEPLIGPWLAYSGIGISLLILRPLLAAARFLEVYGIGAGIGALVELSVVKGEMGRVPMIVIAVLLPINAVFCAGSCDGLEACPGRRTRFREKVVFQSSLGMAGAAMLAFSVATVVSAWRFDIAYAAVLGDRSSISWLALLLVFSVAALALAIIAICFFREKWGCCGVGGPTKKYLVVLMFAGLIVILALAFTIAFVARSLPWSGFMSPAGMFEDYVPYCIEANTTEANATEICQRLGSAFYAVSFCDAGLIAVSATAAFIMLVIIPWVWCAC
jgi:hypothetical protein